MSAAECGEKVVNETKAAENRKRRRNEGGCGSGRAATSNPRQEKRRQKGLGAAYNSGLMAGWTRGRMGRATRRNSNGRQGGDGGIARERITRSLPVAPARASASGRAAHCPSCFSRQRGRLILRLVLPPSSRRPGSGWPVARSLARFSDPLFHWKSSSPPFSRLSLSLPLLLPFVPQKPCSLSGVGPRCSETSYNGVTWPLLSRAPVIPYRLYFSLSRVSPPPKVPPSVGPACSRCIMHTPPAR